MSILSNTLDRRSFVKGASATAALGTCALAAPVASADEAAWDVETDVVVIGSGGAGCCAAISSCEAGAETIVLEKASYPGGSTADSVGCIHSAIEFPDIDAWIESRMEGSVGTVDEAEVRAFVNHEAEMPDWIIDELGMETVPTVHPYNGTTMFNILVGTKTGNGHDLMDFLYNKAVEYGATFMFNTPAVKLVRNWETGEIIGVVADQDGPKRIKARKGVIMALGGYENNQELQAQYNYPGIPMYAWGTPNNTGDGIKLAGEVGAQMWHFQCLEFAGLFPLKAYQELEGNPVYTLLYNHTNFTARNEGGSFIFVNRKGERFMNENMGIAHQKTTLPIFDFSEPEGNYLNWPLYFVCDQKFLEIGPVADIINYYGSYFYSHVGSRNDYDYKQWSPDNQAEIEAGFILKADTPEELAELIGVDPQGLAQSVATFNEEAGGSVEPSFGRPVETMLPLEGPFYALECGMALINTMGGAKRNAESEILDFDNNAIPRLYGAGEFGSFNGGILYMFGNIAEAMTSGRVAGLNAAALPSWDA